MNLRPFVLRWASVLNSLRLADHVFVSMVTLNVNVSVDPQLFTDISGHNADRNQLILPGSFFV